MEWIEGKFIILNVITFCVITFRVTEFYYILRQKLLHFALTSLLHFVSKVITFSVTITFCASYYILWRNTTYTNAPSPI